VQAQNAQVSAGQIGNLPAPPTQELNATVSVQSRLQTAEEFGTIRLKTGEDGSVVRLRDVARIELGSEQYGFSAKYSGHPATAAAIRLAPGADALKTISEVKAKIAEISKQFPADVKVIYPWDTTPFVKVSLKQVGEPLLAMILVFLVMFLFLQNSARP
jgi:multidrug efflux pump subunit AcrB